MGRVVKYAFVLSLVIWGTTVSSLYFLFNGSSDINDIDL